MNIFTEYEKKFGEWLYTAWDFDSVDWNGLAESAQTSIETNTPLTEEQKNQFLETFENGKVY